MKCLHVIPSSLLIALLTGCIGDVTTSQLEIYRGSQFKDHECPTWFIPSSNNTECECGMNVSQKIMCDQNSKQVWLHVTLCVTYDNATKNALVGLCPFSDLRNPSLKSSFVLLPNETSELNEFMCGKMNRVGRLCHKCKPGFGPAVLSYEVKCKFKVFQYILWLAVVLPPCMPSNIFIVRCCNHFSRKNYFCIYECICFLCSM